MKPINFEQANRHMDFPGNEQLHFFQDELNGKVIMLWQFDDEERAKFAETGQIYISQVLGQTAVPMLEVPFREITEEEKAEIELQRKRAKVQTNQEQRNKGNAKRVSLKAVR